MKEKKWRKYTLKWENSVADVYRYMFSPAIYIEFSEISATDYSKGTYKGENQFRIDYTKIGRYECEFLDHTYSYRGENEITILTTTNSGEWVTSASIATKVYHGCVLVVEYDKLTNIDKQIFEKFGIDIIELTEIFNSKLKWCKIVDEEKFNNIFTEMYQANEYQNAEFIFAKAFELLVLLSSKNKMTHVYPSETEYLSSIQVRTVKKIHDKILENYASTISFEKIASMFDITYSSFNFIFKKIYEDTPYQYLKKVRMNIAAEKLKKTNLSIIEIANLVGYSNASKFASAFKSIIGETPNTYRKIK